MKKFLKWLIGLVAFLIACVVVLLLSKDFLARKFFVAMIEKKTGYPATVEKVEVGILSPTLRIQGLMLNYSSAQGGGILLDSPEIFVEYDRNAAKRNEIHLKELRWEVRELGILDSAGTGTSGLMADASKVFSGTNQVSLPDGAGQGASFTGIDTLNFSLGKLRLSNPKDPASNKEIAFDVHNRKLTNVVAAADLAPLAIELAIKAAFGGGGLSPGELPIPGASATAKKAKP